MKSKFLICPPQETQSAEIWERWIRVVAADSVEFCSLEDIPGERNISLLVFFGNDLLRQFIRHLEFRSFLSDKVVYHIGGISDSEVHELTQLGIKAYLGYRGHAPLFIFNLKEEELFRDAILAGLKALCQQTDLVTALEAAKAAWGELKGRNSGSPYDQLVRMFANANLRNLALFGDKGWRSQIHPSFTYVRQPVMRVDRPRIETVDLSPIILEWLREDPARVVQLSPEKFEDLIADRLTRIGLCVTKTGSTNTPDGGIDLIAYPVSSSVPYLLAAQVKHSRTNHPVSASVVRDFRGAITALPIDIGMIVTNTTFTPSAEWAARQLPRLIRLRNLEDLKLWLTNELDESVILKDFPSSIEIAPGFVVPIPWSMK